MVLPVMGFIQEKDFQSIFLVAKRKKTPDKTSGSSNLSTGESALSLSPSMALKFQRFLILFIYLFILNNCHSSLPHWKACDQLFATTGTVILRTEKISMYSAESRPPTRTDPRPHPTPPPTCFRK